MSELTIDLSGVADLSNFSGLVPLFPLATVVFFPNTLLPLHVFEPRYKQMINDVINDERIIGMVLLKPQWEKNYYGNPEIYDVACMGRIVSSEPVEDGKFNIVLYGLKRIRIVEIVKNHPYRVARVKILEDIHEANEDFCRESITKLITAWNGMLGKEQESHKIKIDLQLPLECLTDALASLIVSNIFDRQELLAEPNVKRRAEKIISYLETRLQVVSITSKKRNEILEKRNLN
jgi:Lon protease-like protein